MKRLNELIGWTFTLLVLCFAIAWLFMPEKKQAMQDWWYGSTVDCPALRAELWNDQLCIQDDDCGLARKESIRADKLEKHYARYCGPL